MDRARSLGNRQILETPPGTERWAPEYFSLSAGADISPLLKGLDGDACQSPHWGYLLEGEITVSFSDDSAETVKAGDLFYLPPGHTVRAEQKSEIILFSPQAEHGKVIDHIRAQMPG